MKTREKQAVAEDLSYGHASAFLIDKRIRSGETIAQRRAHGASC